MLSICIPIYNEISEKLIFQLSRQLHQQNINAEIILFDDGSEKPLNKVFAKLKSAPQVKIHRSPENLGRSAARNRLAKLASFNYMLFIDADSEVPDDDFIKRYVQHIKPDIVCCGGTIYQQQKPENKYFLRWKYGHLRETIEASQRQKNPWQQFTTHHFLIDKALFLSIGFSEEIEGYGHEDTLFGYELKKRQIPVLHIDNPLYHTGLESSQVFLNKSKNAIKNLVHLYHKFENHPTFIDNVRLLRFYQNQKKWKLLFLWRAAYHIFRNPTEKQLTSKKPVVSLFNLYKFAYFAYLINKK
ncbi:MAG: glycosyltransferase family 2 protein [Bacteroidota bacterium]